MRGCGTMRRSSKNNSRPHSSSSTSAPISIQLFSIPCSGASRGSAPKILQLPGSSLHSIPRSSPSASPYLLNIRPLSTSILCPNRCRITSPFSDRLPSRGSSRTKQICRSRIPPAARCFFRQNSILSSIFWERIFSRPGMSRSPRRRRHTISTVCMPSGTTMPNNCRYRWA